jgi:hypothetical protein
MYRVPGGGWCLEIGGDCRCAISWPDLRPIVSGGALVGPPPEPKRDTTNCPVHGDVGELLAREIEGFLAKQI